VAIEPGPRGDQVRAFEGVSEYNDESSADSLHQAIQQAAKEAARTLAEEGEELPQVFEVSRLQIIVGNPNVKLYRAVITQAGGG
jgi:flavin-binding protein dodecin